MSPNRVVGGLLCPPPLRALADKGKGKDKSNKKAQVPHVISFTVAGMPRPSGGTGGGDGGASCGKRGPQEGTVTVFTDSSLRDLKVLVAQLCDQSPISSTCLV